MNQVEATKLVAIMCEADGGCPNCASGLLYDFIKEFPDFTQVAKDGYKNEFDNELEDA